MLYEGSPRNHPDWENRAEPVSRAELARIDRLARRLENVSALGQEVQLADDGLHFGAREADEFDAIIGTQLTSSIPFYDFAEAIYLESAEDWVPKEGGIAGTSANGWQAVERAGNTRVPAGTHARLARLSPGRWGFTASALAVEEQDGSPSVAPVTVLRFDQSTGLTVTDSGGGVALVSSSGGGVEVERSDYITTTLEIRRPFGAASATTTGVACRLFDDLPAGRGGYSSTNYLIWSHYVEVADTVDIRDGDSRTAGSTLISYGDGDEVRIPNASGTHYVVVWVTRRTRTSDNTVVRRVYLMRDTAAWPNP